MAKFVIESPHTAEECLEALDSAVEMGVVDKYVFSCETGEHRAFAYVDADSSDAAIEKFVPENLREKASAYEVKKLTAEDIKAFH